ncbi:unnamed protein product [Kluyveromyces dobzhanskii CBS 2104]|uniref:WGS project CCBQ000000000 data, contig 00016 n=1 Tax=Kluyveromyces dobzhanskii CBS 2104 TaxID=1427455 RepID=A0A0A8L2I2_9SACH|nr:unnamed protein product [Kluyveromyces dobzhanskii CBS 2104]
MSNTQSTDKDDILSFVEASKGFFHTTGCQIRESEHGGLGVFALKNLKEETVLLRVPKASVFSAENSSIANLLVDSDIKGILALQLAFIYEVFVFGAESHWYKYLKSIKHKQNGKLYLPPAYWDDEEKKLLNKTALDKVFQALSPQEEIEDGFTVGLTLAKKWRQDFGLQIPTLFDFDTEDPIQASSNLKEFAAIVFAISSRVFEIDNYHDSGLVAIADLFNHDTTSPDVRFESVYDVCELCGEMGDCRHVIAEMRLLDMKMEQAVNKENGHAPRETGTISNSVIEELEKELNSSETQQTNDAKVEESSEDDTEETPEKKMPANIDPDECVDIALANDVEAGEEIFNSYGDHSNAYLLARYGFCVPDNPHDVVDLSDELLEYIQQNSSRFGERMEWWEDELHTMFKEWFLATREEDEDEDGDNDEEEEKEEEEEEEEEIDQEMEEIDEEGEDDQADSRGFVYLEYSGKPNEILLAIINLLTMTPSAYKSLSAARGDAEKLAKRLPLLEGKLSGDGKRLLKRISAAKKYAKLPPKLDTYTLQQIGILVSCEKQILDRVR